MAALKHPNIVGLKDIVYVPRSVFGGPVGAADCPKGCAFPCGATAPSANHVCIRRPFSDDSLQLQIPMGDPYCSCKLTDAVAATTG